MANSDDGDDVDNVVDLSTWTKRGVRAEAPALTFTFAPDGMQRLGARLGLSDVARRMLGILVAYAADIDARTHIQRADPMGPSIAALVGYVASPTDGQAYAQAWNELHNPHAPLLAFGLITMTHHRDTFVQATPRAVALALGDFDLDPLLAGCARLAVDDPQQTLAYAPSWLARLSAALPTTGAVLAYGRPGTGRRSGLRRAYGKPVIELDCDRVRTLGLPWAEVLRTLARECLLHEAAPLLCNVHLMVDKPIEGQPPSTALALLEPGLRMCLPPHLPLLLTATEELTLQLGCVMSTERMPALDHEDIMHLWQRAVPQTDLDDVAFLASVFPMPPALIMAVGRAVAHRARGRAVVAEDVAVGLRTVTDSRLAGLATRLTVTQTWDDVVLTEPQAASLQALIARLNYRMVVNEDWGFAPDAERGRGALVLFSGPPGTGKTVSAGVLARSVGLEVYQVDLAKLVSKWLGETQKHLATLFDAAEACNVALLFDEADALLGKRTEVKSSNDRYANMEVNYLLQRVETFSGLCMLTTNHPRALDEALQRRLAAHIEFAAPDENERARLWERLLPDKAPLDGEIDYIALGQMYNMTGGHIKNSILHAAYAAAQNRTTITMRGLLLGADMEYCAMGRLVQYADTWELDLDDGAAAEVATDVDEAEYE